MRSIRISKNNITRYIKTIPHIQNALSDSQKLTSALRSCVVPIRTYEELVKELAELSYLNKDYLLFYRGQTENHKARTLSSLYPSIYRNDVLNKKEHQFRFSILESASNLLKERLELEKGQIIGLDEIKQIKKIQWSILQHYEVCDTPYLDITHSVRVACSFAMFNNPNSFAYIYILGMPYISGRISVNSEHDIVNIRLLSISPPQALRPFFQEGYLAGTEYITDDYDRKNDLDFNNRLIAVYEIPNNESFWGKGIEIISSNLLFPLNDRFKQISTDIIDIVKGKNVSKSGDVGKYFSKWDKIDEWARSITNSNNSIAKDFRKIKEMTLMSDQLLDTLLELEKFNIQILHDPLSINVSELNKVQISIDEIVKSLK